MHVQFLSVAGTLLVAGTVLGAPAQDRGPVGRPGRPSLAVLQGEVGLSADQTAQLEKMWADESKQGIRRRADLAIARLELEELIEAPTVDEKAVAAKIREVSDLQAAALRARTDQRLAMRKLLSPEQQAKMKQVMRRNRAERGPRPARAWRGRRPGGPGASASPPPPGRGGPLAGENDDPLAPEPER